MAVRSVYNDAIVRVGAGPVEQMLIDLVEDDGDVDLTTVRVDLSHLLVTRESDDSTDQWPVILVGEQSPTLVTVAHVFQPSEVPIPDDLSVMPILWVPGGRRRASPILLRVR